ncbi:hypothetical protein BT96DRAFT_943076 [Gymnopus androsaceus JB14]|uniref:Uncharacterized protein n=1 Tax=Gymnopus androsaceus JB14 TaxID=1447944 RepID=A0A6A4H8T3_9AGAR|nr:hypothetical protein BT96DRAFT_943076 [Gymnopus androsaceus JB14]
MLERQTERLVEIQEKEKQAATEVAADEEERERKLGEELEAIIEEGRKATTKESKEQRKRQEREQRNAEKEATKKEKEAAKKEKEAVKKEKEAAKKRSRKPKEIRKNRRGIGIQYVFGSIIQVDFLRVTGMLEASQNIHVVIVLSLVDFTQSVHPRNEKENLVMRFKVMVKAELINKALETSTGIAGKEVADLTRWEWNEGEETGWLYPEVDHN